MATFDNITVGQTLWGRRRQKVGNTNLTLESIFRLKVLDIDTEKRKVFLLWKGNTPLWWSERDIKKLLIKKPARRVEWWERPKP